jgi:hypothetical protein
MGRKIATLAIGLGPGATGPAGGQLTLEGDVSGALRRLNPDFTSPMAIRSVSGQWAARSQDYLRRKMKKFGHRKWWLNTGELRSAVQRPELWTGAYGPIRVAWVPKDIQHSFSEGRAVRFSNFVRGVGRTRTVTTGEIHIKVLGRITKDMLNDPGQPSYDSRFTGLLESLPESIERKLSGRTDKHYRPVIEPFLTYYLNRQIPNRVWSTLEKSIKPL